MKRREFITSLGGAAASASLWPLAASAQQPVRPEIGFLHSGSQSVWAPFALAFARGLEVSGFKDGQQIAIEYRWAGGALDRLPALAADLVARKVSAIAASGGGIDSVVAAKAATSTIPIVFTTGFDPVKGGLVASLNHPGGNVTGVSILNQEIGLKRLELVTELVPTASTIVLLVNPRNVKGPADIREIDAAARGRGLAFRLLSAGSEVELDAAFESLNGLHDGVLIVAIDSFFNDRNTQITTLAARHAVPAIYYSRVFVMADGLMSYGGDTLDAYYQAGLMVAKILQGAAPAELPVQQSVKFELVINLKAARALGLKVSPALIARADEVIE